MNNEEIVYELSTEELLTIKHIQYLVYGETKSDQYFVRLIYTQQQVLPKYKYIIVFWNVNGTVKQYGAASIEPIKSMLQDIDTLSLGATVH